MIRELVAEVLCGGVKACQGAVDGRAGRETHLGTEIVVPAQTGLASSTWRSRFKSDAISDLESLDGRTDLNDGAGGFVAEHHRVFKDKRADPPFFPIVDVAAADAGVIDGDQDIMRGMESGLGALGKGYIMWFVEDEREILGGSGVSSAFPSELRGIYSFCCCVGHCVTCSLQLMRRRW